MVHGGGGDVEINALCILYSRSLEICIYDGIQGKSRERKIPKEVDWQEHRDPFRLSYHNRHYEPLLTESENNRASLSTFHQSYEIERPKFNLVQNMSLLNKASERYSLETQFSWSVGDWQRYRFGCTACYGLIFWKYANYFV